MISSPFITPRPADAAAGNNPTSGVLPSTQGLNNMFLQLLVAQLQNQSPLNPMDPTQFVSQLAQFSELSEVTSIDQLLEEAIPQPSAAAATPVAAGAVLPAQASRLSSVEPAARLANGVNTQTAAPNFSSGASHFQYRAKGVI